MIAPATPENIALAAKLLLSGGLVAFPTETVYGLGAVATNEEAVSRIFRVKGRPRQNPLIVHLATIDQLASVASIAPHSSLARQVERLAALWPGPLSLVLPRNPAIPAVVAGGGDSVAVRIPHHPVALRLLSEVGQPVAAPSANRAAYVSPTTALHVETELGAEIGLVLDGGACPIGLESTVLSLVGTKPTILRPGAISKRELEERLEAPVAVSVSSSIDSSGSEALASPGLLSAHYSPNTRLVLRGDISPSEYPPRVGLIAFSTSALGEDDVEYSAVHTLSFHGDLHEIAAGLYSALRAQDEMQLDLIVIDPRGADDLFSAAGRARAEDHAGLALALIDRISRAAGKFKIS